MRSSRVKSSLPSQECVSTSSTMRPMMAADASPSLGISLERTCNLQGNFPVHWSRYLRLTVRVSSPPIDSSRSTTTALSRPAKRAALGRIRRQGCGASGPLHWRGRHLFRSRLRERRSDTDASVKPFRTGACPHDRKSSWSRYANLRRDGRQFLGRAEHRSRVGLRSLPQR